MMVPMYTRTTQGGIEAERDRRLMSHIGRAARHVRRPALPHPRIAAAIAAGALADPSDESRWVDDGGWYDREAVGRLRIGDREMKRCNA